MRSLFFLPAVEYGTHCRLREREGGKEREEGRMRRGEEGRHRIMGTHTPEHVCLASCGGPEVSARRTMAHRSVAWPCATRAIRVCLVSSIIARRNRIRRMCIGRKPRRVFSSLSSLPLLAFLRFHFFLSFVGASGETGDHHLRRIYFSFLDPRSRGRGGGGMTRPMLTYVKSRWNTRPVFGESTSAPITLDMRVVSSPAWRPRHDIRSLVLARLIRATWETRPEKRFPWDFHVARTPCARFHCLQLHAAPTRTFIAFLHRTYLIKKPIFCFNASCFFFFRLQFLHLPHLPHFGIISSVPLSGK